MTEEQERDWNEYMRTLHAKRHRQERSLHVMEPRSIDYRSAVDEMLHRLVDVLQPMLDGQPRVVRLSLKETRQEDRVPYEHRNIVLSLNADVALHPYAVAHREEKVTALWVGHGAYVERKAFLALLTEAEDVASGQPAALGVLAWLRDQLEARKAST